MLVAVPGKIKGPLATTTDATATKISFHFAYELCEWLDVFSVFDGAKIFLSEYVEVRISSDQKHNKFAAGLTFS